jgi:DNA-binding transcriptional LysR family regulator
LPALSQGAIDLVVGRIVEGFSVEDFALEPLGDEPMCIVSGVHHPLAARQTLELEELMGETWILQPRGSAIRTPVERALRERNITDLPQILEATSILLTTALLQETTMISVVPLDVARHYSKAAMIRIMPVEFNVNMERQALIMRLGIEPSPAVACFVDALRQIRAKRAKHSNS